MTENYTIKKNCNNCKRDNTLTIPKGTTVKDFIQGKVCFACRCSLEEKKI